jgi:hypothetical protein
MSEGKGNVVVAIILGVLGALGAFILGVLARQPEVNRLKKQVKNLQELSKRGQITITELDRQVDEIHKRYEAFKVWAYMDKKRELFLISCFCKEIIVLSKINKYKHPTSNEEKLFLKNCNTVIDGDQVSKEIMDNIGNYLIKKYNN